MSIRAPDADIEIAVWNGADDWRDFMKERQLRRDFGASLVPRDRCVFLSHGDFECQMASPRMDGRTLCFLDYPWSHPRLGVPHGRLRVLGALTTDLEESDVVLGGAGKLDRMLEAAADGLPEDAWVILIPDCVPLLTGEDVEGVIRRRRKALGPRFIHLNLAADPRATLFERFWTAVRPSRVRKRGRGARVNLAGFADTPGTAELIALLGELGIRVCARLLPDFSAEAIGSWDDGAVSVFLPHGPLEPVYKRVFAGAYDSGLRPPAPFGLEATGVWLRAVARATGREEAFRSAWAGLSSPAKKRWRRIRGRAAAVVADAEGLSCFSDPARTFGVPALPALKEMGLKVRLILHRPPGRRVPARPGVRWFSDRQGLDAALRGRDFRAVLTSVANDSRVTRAGKTPFGLSVFETGLEGSLRALERMRAITGLRFYEEYA